MISLVTKYLEVSGLSIHKEAFEEVFLSHPDYPSIYAITDSLQVFSIESIAIKIPKEQLIELPNFFLALFHNDLVFVNKEIPGIKIKATTGGYKKISFNAFYEGWNGVIIAIEPNKDQTVNIKKSNLKGISYTTTIILLITLSIGYYQYTISNFSLLFTSAIGVLISVFIIQAKCGVKSKR